MNVEIALDNNTELKDSTPIEVTSDDKNLDVNVEQTDDLELTVNKREYSIVGDGLYAGVSSDGAPQWLTSLIDNTVNGIIANKVGALNTAIDSINKSLLELDVAKNKYTELINIEQTIDGVLSTKLETLNATVQANSANIVKLDVAKATPEEALALSIENVNAQVDNGRIHSLVTELQSALSNAEGAWANQVTSLNSVYNNNQSTIEQVLSSSTGEYSTTNNAITDLDSKLIDTNGNVTALSNAQETIETYVGYTDNPNEDIATKLANQKVLLENTIDLQTDKAISYWFQASDVDPASSVAPDGWYVSTDTPEDKEATKSSHYGDLWYKSDAGTAHRYSSSGWVTATDQEKKLLDDIADNKALANNKVSIYKYSDYIPSGKPVDANGFPTSAGIASISNVDVGTTFDLKDNDLLILAYTVDGNEYTDMYEYSGTAWNTSGGTLVARSNWSIDLDAYLKGTDGSYFGADSALKSSVEATSDNKIATAFEYDSSIVSGGVTYNSGFGLANRVDNGDGTGTSEFWINADKFKIISGDSYVTGDDPYSPFTVTRDSTTGKHTATFNGAVSINSMIDENENSVTVGVRLADSSSNPVSAYVGDSYYNTTDGIVYTYTSVGWVSTAGSPGFSPEITDNNDGTYSITTSGGGSVVWRDGDNAVPPTITPVTNANGDVTSYTLDTKNNDGSIKETVSINNPLKNVDYFDGLSGNYISYVFIVDDTVNGPGVPQGGSYSTENGEVLPLKEGSDTIQWTDTPTHNDNDYRELVSKQVYVPTRDPVTGVETWTGQGWSTPTIFYLQAQDGVTTYTWVKYAEDVDGTNMVDTWQTGKSYIGIAYNKTTITESSVPADYIWTRIEGTNGNDGMSIWYKWVGTSLQTKVSYTSPGSGWLQTETSVNLKGEPGEPGEPGEVGSRGPGWYHTTGSSWSDTTADTATPGSNVIGDIVTISDSTFSQAKKWDGTSWGAPGLYLNGDMIIDGTLTAQSFSSSELKSIDWDDSTDTGSMKIDLANGSIYIS